ncbi:DsbA family protein [Microvirga sp. VF16]|uniref:DsbA family protein n=1 Tax=Microvirga sp. VF16 TaxID=2807101 RepID=UPI00193CE928|nr:DsbA family protein [Microvirga sp. VF16]
MALSVIAMLLSGMVVLIASGVFDANLRVQHNFEAQAREHLLRSPEVILEAVERLEEHQKAKEGDELITAIAKHRDEIFNDPTSPVGGNPNGNVSVVELFDYNCLYCRRAASALEQAQDADGRLRAVYKEFPILGPRSAFAARAALVSHKQGKYGLFHKAMMAHSSAAAESTTFQVAQDVGLDLDRLKQDMDDPKIAQMGKRSLTLAGELRITGTPSWIIGDWVAPGLMDLPALRKLIHDARQPPNGAE